MQTGISTASLFVRYTTEDALRYLAENKIKTAEIFLSTYCEYSKEFGKILKSVQGETDVHSIHVLNTQFEPQLYSIGERANRDAFLMLDQALQAGKEVGAKYYTFHGVARLKKTPLNMDFERIGRITQKIIDKCKEYNITLSYENVHWAYYNYIGFFSELKKRVSGLKGTLDIKQARQSGIHYSEFIKEMNSDIVTVHISDVDENGKMCLPGRGVTDFNDLFSRLKDVGFDGAVLLEVYKNDYDNPSELITSLDFINEVADKVF
ncbi:MAG: sugar phosphate isomerase/epimerase [Clostridiales bacterium]|nr:sugar phosphate isomerase/epimerase [Clostridiales bacterium]